MKYKTTENTKNDKKLKSDSKRLKWLQSAKTTEKIELHQRRKAIKKKPQKRH